MCTCFTTPLSKTGDLSDYESDEGEYARDYVKVEAEEEREESKAEAKKGSPKKKRRRKGRLRKRRKKGRRKKEREMSEMSRQSHSLLISRKNSIMWDPSMTRRRKLRRSARSIRQFWTWTNGLNRYMRKKLLTKEPWNRGTVEPWSCKSKRKTLVTNSKLNDRISMRCLHTCERTGASFTIKKGLKQIKVSCCFLLVGLLACWLVACYFVAWCLLLVACWTVSFLS